MSSHFHMLFVILVSLVLHMLIPIDSYHLKEGVGTRALWHYPAGDVASLDCRSR